MLVLDKLNRYKVVLFSGSPRRKEILERAKIEFSVYNETDINEVYPDELRGVDVARYLSHYKASRYPLNIKPSDVIITADTIVVVDDIVYGKPKDRDDAAEMLRTLSGRTHNVVTAFSIRTYNEIHTFDVNTSVTFRLLHDEEIKYYISNYKPFDKAGAYGIQEWIGYVGIKKIEGSYFNVMGFPICEVYQRLNEILI